MRATLVRAGAFTSSPLNTVFSALDTIFVGLMHGVDLRWGRIVALERRSKGAEAGTNNAQTVFVLVARANDVECDVERGHQLPAAAALDFATMMW